MEEVLTAYKNSDQTFFLSVNIMDRYFKNTRRILLSTDVHLIGIVCMFIASKYEDVKMLHMKTIITKIGHNKF